MRRTATNDDGMHRAEEILTRVQALPPSERASALEHLCHGDRTLAVEVASMLKHSAEIDGFLETPALGPSFSLLPATADSVAQDDAERDDLVGRRLGRYRIERRIASGGMGTIYLGTRADQHFTQRVAIKIVKRGMDTDEILMRFRRERQTLAALEHPNIARLIDGGATRRGQPYLVMEFVEGEQIDSWCDRRELNVDARLELFLIVCDAVRHAHQNLVVHRDLKPSNILVTSDGTPKLLDFGIAMVLDRPGAGAVTGARDRWLTPEYASPEHVSGAAVSTTSDVYSLGAILCKLLSGRTPFRFDERTAEEVQRVVAASEPPAPSELVRHDIPTSTALAAARARHTTPERLVRRLRGDLDTIVLAALRKEPARRYPSVEALAADVRRHLDRMPVTARRDIVLYRVGRFAQRHAWATAFACVSLVLLFALGATFAWQARVATSQRDQALLARSRSEAITGFLAHMLESADPSHSGPGATVHDMLDEAARRLDSELSDQPLVQAGLRGTIGRTYLSLGLYGDAEAQLRTALRQRVELAGPDHVDSAASMCDLACVLYAVSALDEAEVLLEDAVKIFRNEPEPVTAELATALSSLGAVKNAQGRLDEAERLQREALELRRHAVGGDRLGEAESLNNLSGVLRARGHGAAARPLLEEALQIRREQLGADHPLVAQSLDNLALHLHREGELDAAEPLYRQALEIETRVLGPSHPEAAVTCNNLAHLLIAKGDLSEAEEHLRRCLAIRENCLPSTDSRRLLSALNLAEVLLARNKGGEAEPLVTGALDAVQDLGLEAPVRVMIVARAAAFFEKRGDSERAAGLRTQRPAR